jgi:hypothetical protein
MTDFIGPSRGPIDQVLLRAPMHVPASAHAGPDDGLDDRAGPHVSRMQRHGEISASPAWAGAGTDRVLVGAASRRVRDLQGQPHRAEECVSGRLEANAEALG